MFSKCAEPSGARTARLGSALFVSKLQFECPFFFLFCFFLLFFFWTVESQLAVTGERVCVWHSSDSPWASALSRVLEGWMMSKLLSLKVAKLSPPPTVHHRGGVGSGYQLALCWRNNPFKKSAKFFRGWFYFLLRWAACAGFPLFLLFIIIISFFKEQTKARRDKRPNGCSLCSSLTQTLWWLKLKNISHRPTPPTPHHPKSIWKLSRRHWLLPIWSGSSRPQLSVVPSSWRRGLLFESEYILGSAASRSATVMDWWVDGWIMQVRLPPSFFLSFIFLLILQPFPRECPGGCAGLLTSCSMRGI